MSERRFRITEILDGVGGITEYELKRRLSLIRLIREWKGNLDAAVDILLHGDKPQDEVLHDEVEKYDEKPWPGPEDIIKMRRGEKREELPKDLFHGPPEYRERAKITDNQPSPAPTREEWEAWAHQLSHKLITKIYASHIAQRADVKDSLLSMPIVPKE